MTRRLRRPKAAKLLAVCVVSVVAVLGLTNSSRDGAKVSASANGPTPSHTNAPGEANCTACHSDFTANSGPGNVVLSGIPANYLPNQAIAVTVRVNQADAVVFGFQMTVVDARGQTPPSRLGAIDHASTSPTSATRSKNASKRLIIRTRITKVGTTRASTG